MDRNNRIALCIYVITSIVMIGCNNITNKEEKMEDRKTILTKYKFKFPTELDFRKKISEVFGYEVTDMIDTINITSIANDEPDFLIINSKNKYIDLNTHSDVYDNEQYLVAFNNYIFYRDKLSFTILKTNSYHILMLVQDFGFWDENMKKYIFDNINKRPTDDSWFFVFFGRDGIDAPWKLRRNIFKQFIEESEYYQELFITYIDTILKVPYNTVYEGNLEEDIAYILEIISEKSLKNETPGIIGIISHSYTEYPYLLETFKKNNYYKFKHLKLYSEYYLSDLNDNDTISQTGTIYDSDGYTNLRKEANTNSEILKQIKSGELVTILKYKDNWCLVKTKDGQQGYIHESRIK